MKKSMNETPAPATERVNRVDLKPPLGRMFWDILSGEGGICLLVIFPLIVIFFLSHTLKDF